MTVVARCAAPGGQNGWCNERRPCPKHDAVEQSKPAARPQPCMSRHLDNIGKPRPPVEWTITYSCVNGHVQTDVPVCDRCASSLVDGNQRCAVCMQRMAVADLVEVVAGDAAGAPV